MSKTLKVILGGGVIIIIVVIIAVVINYNKYKRDATGFYTSSGNKKQTVNSEIAPPYTTAPAMEPKAAGSGYAEEDVSLMPNDRPGTDGQQVVVDHLIIKTGNISVVVKDVNQSIKAMASFAEKVGGFVVASNIYKSGTAPYGVVTIRIPSAVFDQGVGETKGLGDVVSEDIRGTDVTEEYVDLSSQLKNLQATEEQFLNIMKRAEKIDDILAVQNQLTQVRGRIEGITGRMKYLKQSSDLSSLTVNFSTDPSVLPVVNQETDKWKPVVVIKDALRSLVEVGKVLMNALIWIAIFVPVWGIILVIIWLIYRRTKRSGVSKK